MFFPGMNFVDTVSNMNIHVADVPPTGPDRQVFNKPVAVAVSGDDWALKTAAAAAEMTGVGEFSISQLPLTAGELRFWRRDSASAEAPPPDVLGFLYRVSLPVGEDQNAANKEFAEYLASYWPIKVYLAPDEITEPKQPLKPRLRPRWPNDVAPADSAHFDEPHSRSRSPSYSSSSLKNETELLSAAVAELHEAVLETFKQSKSETFGKYHHMATTPLNMTVLGFYDNWDAVLAMATNDSFVLGTRDAVYGVPPLVPPHLHDYFLDSAVVLIGVNHRSVNDMCYNSAGLSVYGSSMGYIGTNLAPGHVSFTCLIELSPSRRFLFYL